MKFIITDVQEKKYKYSNYQEALFKRLYNNILPEYYNQIKRVCDKNSVEKIKNEFLVRDILQSSVPGEDFALDNKQYILAVFNHIIQNY